MKDGQPNKKRPLTWREKLNPMGNEIEGYPATLPFQLQAYSLLGYREEWAPGLRPATTPRKPRLTALDLILLREMRIRL